MIIKNRKFLLVSFFCIAIYFLIDYIFPDAMLYLTGGIIGGTIKELLRNVDISPNENYFIIVWFILLIGVILLYYHFQNKAIKYFLLILIAVLLYVIDFILLQTLNFDVVDLKTRYFSVAINVLSKGFILASLIHFELKKISPYKSTH